MDFRDEFLDSLLEGLLEHKTSLNPREVMSDTAGYRDLVFGLFWLLGYHFSPRLADLGEARFWRIDAAADYGELDRLARQRVNTKLIARNWDDMLRIAGSLKLGTISASELTRSLLRSSRPSTLARAIGELGRVPKTLYLLSYIDDSAYRRLCAWQHTASEHQDRIREYLRLSDYDPQQADALERFVFEESCRLEQTASLLARAREFLKERRVLFPADSALLRLVGEQKKRAREHIVTKLVGGLSPGVIKVLDGLLEVKEGEAVSGLQGIKANPAKPSATAMQRLADKLADIEATGALAVDLSWLNANYQRALFHYVRKCSADRLREAGQDRRLAALVCFLRQSYRDAVDQAVDMFDKLLTRTHTRAEHELDDQMRGQRQTIKAALAALRSLGAIILDDSVAAVALRPRLFAAVPRDALEAQVAGLDEWVTGKKSDVFHGLVRRFSHLRQFSPVLLRALEFLPDTGDGDVPCLEALRVLKEINADLKRKLPDDAPTDFIPKRLLPLVVIDGKANRKAWECACW